MNRTRQAPRRHHRSPSRRPGLLVALPALLAALSGQPARAQETPALLLSYLADQVEAADGREAAAEPAGGVVGDIRIVTQGIFDPEKRGEDKRLFRLANRLHRTTRPGVIARQLLLRPGDPYSPEAVAESERLLRTNRYLYDAEIRPIPAADGRVDLEVTTRDVWTLRAGLSVNRAGGENSTNFSLQDSNFLGSGKDLTLWHITTVDRDSTLLRYRDPHLLGSRTQLEVSYADYSDGGAQRLEIERPFYSFDSRWSTGFKMWLYNRIDSLYDRGEILQRFRHQRDFVEVYAGLSPGRSGNGTRRWRAGLTVERHLFEYPPGGDSTPLPPDRRKLVYPWIGYEYVEDGFVVEHDLDQIRRAEDLNLGRQVQLRLGYTLPGLGADRSWVVAEGGARMGWRPSPRQLVLTSAQGSTRWGDGGAEDLLVGAAARYYLRTFGNSVFYAALQGDVAHDLDPEDQLLLGGDSGLRGYPLRFQSGDRRALLTLEQRFFSTRELFHLFHLGAAVFFDAGRAWFDDDTLSGEQKLLRDVGVGLRLGSSRSSSGAMIHLDLAFPLDGDDSIDSLQWLVSTSETF